MDIQAHNRIAWDNEVKEGNPWTKPVTSAQIEAARRGEWSVLLTPSRPVPRDWFPDLANCNLLGLASGGGQQAPIFAAAGAQVTVLDNSPAQLAQDQFVAERDGLTLTTIQGDMADLSMFPDAQFDLIFHPVSNVFVPEILPVWREAFRVLRAGGALLAGIANPLIYLFDLELAEKENILTVKYKLPYSDTGSLPPEKLKEIIDKQEPLEFSHTLEEQIGGQLKSGFLLADFYEDGCLPDDDDPICKYVPPFFATRAIKP